MKKAVISNRIYLSSNEHILKYLKEHLYYVIPSKHPRALPEIIYDVIKINSDVVSIPVGRTDLIPSNYDIVDKRTLAPVAFPDFTFTLRDSQQEVYDMVDDNYLINAQPGWGKTFTALAIAHKLGQKTLVIVHTISLRDQWASEIKKVFGFSPDVIGSGKFGTSTPIVVSNIQTLRKRALEIRKEFGTVIVDECLDYETRIKTKEYGIKKLGAIVNQKLDCHVQSWNGTSWEYNKVLNYYKNPQDLFIHFKFDNSSTLKATENHKIYQYKNGKIVETLAGNLLEGDYVVCKKDSKTTNLLIGPVLGFILGDGSLAKTKNSVRIKVTHGQDQKEYLEYKKQLLSNICSDASIVQGKSGFQPNNHIYSVSTLSFLDEEDIHAKVYAGNSRKTSLPKCLADKLSIFDWAIMYQDDGSINKHTINFHLYFDEEGSNNLIYSLAKLFGVHALLRPYEKNGKILNKLALSTTDSEIFLQKIKNYIHPSMYYKFGTFDSIKDTAKFENDVNIPPIYFKSYSATKIVEIGVAEATGGYRYNIEVDKVHNYTANNKLVSNCHHLPASSFKETVDLFSARYKIGLSATLGRTDRKEMLIYDYIHKTNLVRPQIENKLTPEILVLNTDIEFPYAGNWSTAINELTSNPEYIEMIVGITETLKEAGHNVLVLNDRVTFLEICYELVPDSMLMVGSSKFGNEVILDRESAHERVGDDVKVIFGTTSIYKEGIDIPQLSCIVLTTPTKNKFLLEQIIGRATRPYPGKLNPLIVDIALQGAIAKKHLTSRLDYYIIDNKYKVRHEN